jgi:hypothetical protein
MKHSLTKLLATIMLSICFLLAIAQKLKTLKPEIGETRKYTKDQQVVWQTMIELYKKIDEGKITRESLTAKQALYIDSLDMELGPLTQGSSCDWYCGGKMTKVTATSALPKQGSQTYTAEKAHDFNLQTAWIPDTSKSAYGIGAKIDFHFAALSPRVTSVKIYNGYIKNIDLWKAHARIKKCKLYFNNQVYAILELADNTAYQIFNFPAIRSTVKGKDLVVTIEIMEVYPGTTYKLAAISEINFNGLDVN